MSKGNTVNIALKKYLADDLYLIYSACIRKFGIIIMAQFAPRHFVSNCTLNVYAFTEAVYTVLQFSF